MTAVLSPEREHTATADWLWTLPLSEPRPHEMHGALPVTVSFAGWLTNRDALSRELHLPFGVDDQTCVAAAYERWGADLLTRLRGPFALAIRDPRQSRVIVARDHLGLQPLFFARHADYISFAATPQRLVRHPAISGELNRVALADALCRRYPDPAETFYQHVRRVLAGTCLLIARGDVRAETYWHPHAATSRDVPQTEDEAYEAFDALHEQAVRRGLDRGRAAIFLSGGLDSTSVAVAAAACARPNAPVALSLTFPGGSCDEQHVQRATAAALGLPQQLLPLEAALQHATLLDAVRQLSEALPSPLMNYWRPAYLELAKRGRLLGATTILTGHGGDEWLLSPVYELADLLGRGHVLTARQFLATWARSEQSRGLLWHCGFRPLAGRLVAGVAPHWWDRRRARRLCAPDPEWAAPDPVLRTAQRQRAAGALGPARPDAGFARAERDYTLRGATCQQDREEYAAMGRLSGVRFHHPYHDVDLVEFCCTLPTPLLSAGGWLRGLTRRQLAERLPGSGFERQTKVMGTEFHRATLRRAVAAMGGERLRFSALEGLGVLDHERFVQRVVPNPERFARRIFDASSLEAWVGAQNRTSSADIVS